MKVHIMTDLEAVACASKGNSVVSGMAPHPCPCGIKLPVSSGATEMLGTNSMGHGK